MKVQLAGTDTAAPLDAPKAKRLAISSEEYHAISALSYSGMKDLAVSPLRYWHRWINPDRQPEPEKDCFVLGDALHCFVLEGERAYFERFAHELDLSENPDVLHTVADIRDWIKSKGFVPKGTVKADLIAQVQSIDANWPIRDVLAAEHATACEGKTMLKIDEYNRVDNMAAVILAEPRITDILREGQPEVSITGHDPKWNVPLKARLDWVSPEWILDLKTFSTKRGSSINRTIADAIYYEGYHRQAYLYSMLEQASTGGARKRFAEVFIESEEPHEICIREFRPTYNGERTLYWQIAELEVHDFCYLWRRYRDEFGDKPWIHPQEIRPLENEDLPRFAYAN